VEFAAEEFNVGVVGGGFGRLALYGALHTHRSPRYLRGQGQ
jgi:hypothetical protein